MTRTHIAQPISVSDITEVCDNCGHYVGESRVIVTVSGNCTAQSLFGRRPNLRVPPARGGRVEVIKYMHDSDESVIEYRFRYAGIIRNRFRNSEHFRTKMLKQIEKQKHKEIKMNKTKKDKILVKPVGVSQCQPVYVNGKIKSWTVRVEYAGDVAVNTQNIYAWREIISKNPDVMKNNPFYCASLQPIFDTHVVIPNAERLNGYFEYNFDRDISVLEYSWPDGLFGRGSERAWQFRLKMLAQAQKQRGM